MMRCTWDRSSDTVTGGSSSCGAPVAIQKSLAPVRFSRRAVAHRHGVGTRDSSLKRAAKAGKLQAKVRMASSRHGSSNTEDDDVSLT